MLHHIETTAHQENCSYMKIFGFVFAFVIACASLLAPEAFAAASAQPFVSPIFGDNMVLQRGKKNALWGWSEPGDKVSVQIGNKSATAVAGKDRRWQVMIDPPAVGGPYIVKITGRETVELHNVLVGDVWLCAGQSNMMVSLRFAHNGAEEIKTADAPDIRVFTVAQHTAYRSADTVEGKWMAVSPQTRAKSRQRRTFQSDWLWRPLAERQPSHGPAPRRSVH
jgi:sialate O-acetylesterase